MVSTRSKPTTEDPPVSTENQSQVNKKKTNKKKKKSNTRGENSTSTPLDETTNEDNSTEPTIFRSRFPGLEMETFENHLDNWTLTSLRQAITKQDLKNSKAPSEIKTLVKGIRLEYEKRMLMAALMGGVPEAVVWNLV